MGKTLLGVVISCALMGCEPVVAPMTDAGMGDATATDAPPAPIPMCITRPGRPRAGVFCDEANGWEPVCNPSSFVRLHWERRDPVTGAPSAGGICLPFLVDTSATASPTCDGVFEGEPAVCDAANGSPQCLAPDATLRCPEWFF